ncbi:MAG: sarcosine oxidase subunit alpha family protein, partial [Gammaproteobacteria bacterium]|nr:sarcosine oxidase subunit alpha family protein [Gammaproteobacteria bacterium]
MADTTRRLPEGGAIDRSRPLAFTFNGRALTGYEGDTLASALLANGVDVVGSSFKYGRPRGIVGFGVEEPNAIVHVGEGSARTPNLRATTVELEDGMVATSAARGPGAVTGALARTFGRLLPAGFYYKTFMRPQGLWGFWEERLRAAAGLGDVPEGPDPDTYERRHGHADVLVVGAGPAGLAAALAASRAGARVMLVDENTAIGGAERFSPVAVGGESAGEWRRRALAELADNPDVTLLPHATAFGLYDHNFVGILERSTHGNGTGAPRQRLHQVRARQVMLACGAIERPIVFAGNDLPGVMLASAVSAYTTRHAVAPGERLVLFTSNDSAYETALIWHRIGREVTVVDARPVADGARPGEARAAGIDIRLSHVVQEAHGRRRVMGVEIAPVGGGEPERLDCDLVASSGGWNPLVHLSAQTGVRPVWSEAALAFLPGSPRSGVHHAGAINGHTSTLACLREGFRVGSEAARLAGFESAQAAPDLPTTDEQPSAPGEALFVVPHPRPGRDSRQFVDLQLDVTVADIELAAREGYRSVEHAKRYTALGFGTDQGKLGNVNGVAILASALGQGIEETGTTMFRPPYTPVTFGAVAGRDVGELFDPVRRTPMHEWHEAHGAVWEDVGRWKRPRYYARGAGESMDEAVRRECLAARGGVAMLDASTLGKIDVQGADAARFLDRVYSNGFRRLAAGRCRYGLMLREDGTILDDGVTVRVAENRYLVHTTTGNAEAVLSWLELWRQTEWPELNVHLTSVTDHWATAAVVGPKSRTVLRRVCTDIDLSPDAFRFMDYRAGHVAGVPARVYRISFSGELSFEVNVAAQHGARVWKALMAAGEDFGITPYGTETMHVLRAEMGFIIVGQDTDGSMTPDDMGLAGLVRQGKPWGFLGDRSLSLPEHQRPDRPQLVGLAPLNQAAVLPEGAQLVTELRPKLPAKMHGHVTSSHLSAALGHSFALAMVKGGRERMGETLYSPQADGSVIPARVVPSVFLKPVVDADEGETAAESLALEPPGEATAPAMLNLQGDGTDEFRQAASEVLHVALPEDPCTTARNASIAIHWLAPDEWLIVAPPGEEAELERRLREATTGPSAAITDVTGAHILLRLSGPQAREALASAAPYDL